MQAFEAATGRLLWQFDPKVPGAAAAKACCDVVNRGAAYWNGHVYVGTIDGRLIALDGRTGAVLWSKQTTDPTTNNTITGAPRVVRGRVVIGNGGAELGARGYVTAYDAETGRKEWRFYIVPGDPARADGEVSDEPLRRLARTTWSGKWWTHEGGGGGGGTAWDSMAYDPDLDLLYIGTGNASYWNKAFRSPGGGDNLFVGSVLALILRTARHADCGYEWHHHRRIALALGMPEPRVEQIATGEKTGEDDHDLMICVADELAADKRLSTPTWDTMVGRFGLPYTLDAIFTVGAYTALAMGLNSCGVQIEGRTSRETRHEPKALLGVRAA